MQIYIFAIFVFNKSIIFCCIYADLYKLDKTIQTRYGLELKGILQYFYIILMCNPDLGGWKRRQGILMPRLESGRPAARQSSRMALTEGELRG